MALAALAAAAVPAGAGAVVVRPIVTSFTAVPVHPGPGGSFSGGALTLTVAVNGATNCTFTGSRRVADLPRTVDCSQGDASITVDVPENVRRSGAPFPYKFKVRGYDSAGIGSAATSAFIAVDLSAPFGPVQQVVGNGDSTCALDAAGQVWCWGSARLGQLGNGNRNGPDKCPGAFGTPQPCSRVARPVLAVTGDGALDQVTELAVSGPSYCAVRSDRTAVCWGDGTKGQLGVGPNTLPAHSSGTGADQCDDAFCSTRPVAVAFHAGPFVLGLEYDEDVVHLTGGTSGFCATLASGHAKCWGSNQFSALGSGYTSLVSGPDLCTTPSQMWSQTGSTACGTTPDYVRETLLDVHPLRDVLAIVSRPSSSSYCAIVTAPDGYTGRSVSCWGHNDVGQLGAGVVSDSERFAQPVVDVFGSGRLDRVTGIAGAGYGDYQQAGSPDAKNPASNSYCATVQGEVVCWGDNMFGELGQGDHAGAQGISSGPQTCGLNPCSPVPVIVHGDVDGSINTAVEVTAGVGGYCARLASGATDCWGRNNVGSLGDGSGFTSTGSDGPEWCGPSGLASLAPCSTTPVRVITTSAKQASFDSLVGLGSAFCGTVPVSGAVRCWGDGSHGQLGDGSFGASSAAALVKGLAGIERVAGAMGAKACAHNATMDLVCWGAGDLGELGAGQLGPLNAFTQWWIPRPIGVRFSPV